jgi:hypothetical protein
MMITETSHFKSREAAISYYKPYGWGAAEIDHALLLGEIHIGPPGLKPDGSQRFFLIDDGMRYAIEDSK